MHKRRFGHCYLSGLAVFALLAQLMLAATHVHLGEPHGEHRGWPIAFKPHNTDHSPDDPIHQGNRSCSLCWVQAAAHSLLAPPAIELQDLASIATIELTPVFNGFPERTLPNAFRPRAPPAARYA